METIQNETRILNYEEIKRAIILIVEQKKKKKKGFDTSISFSCNLPQLQLLRYSPALRKRLKHELRQAGYSCREFISLDNGEHVLVFKW